MIDTDKYEELIEDANLDTYECVFIAKELIAEVKRLRELYTHYYLVANHYEGDRCLENCPICYGDD
tara:strand:- start:21 stop:218 length:198 start_codon:yes stop_codon:yes gene_type:complete